MIVRRGFHPWRIVKTSGPQFVTLLVYDTVVSALYLLGGPAWLSLPDLPLPLLGSAVALVVTLRNNAAYARWWEARTLWGAILNNGRSFARAVTLYIPDPTLRTTLIRLMIAYPVAVRCHLLRLDPWPDLEPLVAPATLPPEILESLRGRANVPAAILGVIAANLARAGLDNMALSGLDRYLGCLTDAQGGLERIKNTPMPRRYNQFPMLFSRAYCIMLPLGLLNTLGWATPVGSTLIGFMFLALDRMGLDLEDPFENTTHDIPMRAIARTIEIDLLQQLGDDAPTPIKPVDGVLW